MNLAAVAAALAANYGTVSASVGSETETVTATEKLPNQVGRLALLVYPPTGELGIGVSAQSSDAYEFPVRLLRDPLSMPARSDWLYAWATALRYKAETNVNLDLDYVDWAQSVAMRIEPDGESYAGVEGATSFDVVEIIVRVRLSETVSTLAI